MEERDVVPLKEAEALAGRSTLYRLIAAELVTPLKVRGDKRTHVSLAEVRAALATKGIHPGRKGRWEQPVAELGDGSREAIE